MSVLPAGWDRLLNRPFDREPHRTTLARAEAEASAHTVYPPRGDWFAAFRLTPPETVRAVILGQDPYHGAGEAMGLAFSVTRGTRLPPSLRNMYRELASDLGRPAPPDGDLSFWAEQGVLLLNTVLTVEADRANSHRSLGWQAFTDEVLAALAGLPQPIAFVLWGSQAQEAYRRGTGSGEQGTGNRPPCRGGHWPPAVPLTHMAAGSEPACRDKPCLSAGPRLILEAPHPSPLSAYRGFFGSRPYSQINRFLAENGVPPIQWTRSAHP